MTDTSPYHILVSYGATTTIFSFFEPVETIQFQALNKWLYKTAVARVQTQLKLPRPKIYLTNGTGRKSKNKLVVYDVLSGQYEETREDDSFMFWGNRSVQVCHDLFTVS